MAVAAVTDGFNFKHRLELEDHDFEAIWIEGKINKTQVCHWVRLQSPRCSCG